MIGIVLGVAVIALGLKGLTATGIPLTRQKQITGRAAKIIGICCILLGIVFIADGAWSSARIWKQLGTPTPQQAPLSAPVATLDPALWRRFDAGYGDFSILLPKAPKAQDTGRNPKIGKVEGRLFLVEDGDRVYQVVYTKFDRPSADSKQEFDAGRENAVAASGGTLRSERDLEIVGHPAREFLIDAADGSVARIVLVMAGQNLYQIWAIGSKGFEDTDLVDDFFKSFELKAPEAAASTSAEATDPVAQ